MSIRDHGLILPIGIFSNNSIIRTIQLNGYPESNRFRQIMWKYLVFFKIFFSKDGALKKKVLTSNYVDVDFFHFSILLEKWSKNCRCAT